MEHIIIGTAGHIDHGKTTLIKALTGRDTDRLAEEKRRGITIDLGFTYFDLPDGNRAGIIDVPGHEKFIPNMVAGVTGMDLVLLVIAMDEGIMPQTTEHMEILNQLGVTNCIIILNKADLVDEEWAEMITEDIKEKMSDTAYKDAPMVKVSAKTGAGMQELVQLVTEKVNTFNRKGRSLGHFRLPVDRVFSMPGFGTIVTGTLLEGKIQKEDVIRLFPGDTQAKIRGIQVHGQEVEECSHGQRVALNLANVKKEEVSRGNVVATPFCMENTSLLDVRLHVISSTERVIENRIRLHLYLGTDELLCRAVLLDQTKLGPGESGLVQLRLEKPLAVRKGDHFIVRFYSPLETIGGGVVLDANPVKRKRFDEQAISFLEKKEAGKDDDLLTDILTGAFAMPLTLEQLVQKSALEEKYLQEMIERLAEEGTAVIIPGNKKNFYWNDKDAERTKRNAVQIVQSFHKQNPYKPGIGKSVLMSESFKGWQIDKYDAVLRQMVEEKLLKRSCDVISLTDFAIVRDAVFLKVAKTLTKSLEKAGFDFIQVKDIDFFKVPVEQVNDIMAVMMEEGILVKVSEDFYTLTSIMKTAEEKIKEYFQRETILSIASLRDLLGTTRRSAKPILFYMDSVRITRFNGKETERIAYQ